MPTGCVCTRTLRLTVCAYPGMGVLSQPKYAGSFPRPAVSQRSHARSKFFSDSEDQIDQRNASLRPRIGRSRLPRMKKCLPSITALVAREQDPRVAVCGGDALDVDGDEKAERQVFVVHAARRAAKSRDAARDCHTRRRSRFCGSEQSARSQRTMDGQPSPTILPSAQVPRALLVTAAGLGPNLAKGRNMDKVDGAVTRMSRATLRPSSRVRRVETITSDERRRVFEALGAAAQQAIRN